MDAGKNFTMIAARPHPNIVKAVSKFRFPLRALSAGGAADPGPGEARREPGHGRGLGSSGADGGAQGRCLSRYSEILS